MKCFKGIIQKLNKDQIFVFGSNEAGIHGIGAAKKALIFGAIYGQGYGLQGQSFAIPTKNNKLETLNIDVIQKYVTDFLEYSKNQQDKEFLITNIGCGYAGYLPERIAPLFFNNRNESNLIFSEEFIKVFLKIESTCQN